MKKEDIIKYVIRTPHNTNPNMLSTMLDALIEENEESEPQPEPEVETYTITLVPMCNNEEIKDFVYWDVQLKYREDISENNSTLIEATFTSSTSPEVTVFAYYMPMTLIYTTIYAGAATYVPNTNVAPVVVSGNAELDEFNEVVIKGDCVIKFEYRII